MLLAPCVTPGERHRGAQALPPVRRVGFGDLRRDHQVEVLGIQRRALAPIQGADQRDLAVNDHGFGMRDPHAAVDPDRPAGPDDPIDTGMTAAGRGPVGDQADVDAALRRAGERFGNPRTHGQAIGADQDLALGAIHRVHRKGIAVPPARSRWRSPRRS